MARYLRGDDGALSELGAVNPAKVRRLGIYKRLVVNQFKRLFSSSYPHTRAALGRQAFDELVSAFIGQHDCQTPYYPHMTTELAAWLITAQHQYSNSTWVSQLAHFEALMHSLTWERDHSPQDKLVLSPLARIPGYQYDISSLLKDEQPLREGNKETEPVQHETFFLVWRRSVIGSKSGKQAFQAVRWRKITHVEAVLAGLLEDPIDIDTGAQDQGTTIVRAIQERWQDSVVSLAAPSSPDIAEILLGFISIGAVLAPASRHKDVASALRRLQSDRKKPQTTREAS